jgi:hypothetical protein
MESKGTHVRGVHRQREDLVGNCVLRAQLVRAAAHRVRHARERQALLRGLAAPQQRVRLLRAPHAHEAQHQRAARYHALATGQLDAGKALQHARLARGLVSDHRNLGQINAVQAHAPAVVQDVAQLVHRVNQRTHRG